MPVPDLEDVSVVLTDPVSDVLDEREGEGVLVVCAEPGMVAVNAALPEAQSVPDLDGDGVVEAHPDMEREVEPDLVAEPDRDTEDVNVTEEHTVPEEDPLRDAIVMLAAAEIETDGVDESDPVGADETEGDSVDETDLDGRRVAEPDKDAERDLVTVCDVLTDPVEDMLTERVRDVDKVEHTVTEVVTHCDALNDELGFPEADGDGEDDVDVVGERDAEPHLLEVPEVDEEREGLTDPVNVALSERERDGVTVAHIDVDCVMLTVVVPLSLVDGLADVDPDNEVDTDGECEAEPDLEGVGVAVAERDAVSVADEGRVAVWDTVRLPLSVTLDEPDRDGDRDDDTEPDWVREAREDNDRLTDPEGEDDDDAESLSRAVSVVMRVLVQVMVCSKELEGTGDTETLLKEVPLAKGGTVTVKL